jgi:hypothetical protein
MWHFSLKPLRIHGNVVFLQAESQTDGREMPDSKPLSNSVGFMY